MNGIFANPLLIFESNWCSRLIRHQVFPSPKAFTTDPRQPAGVEAPGRVSVLRVRRSGHCRVFVVGVSLIEGQLFDAAVLDVNLKGVNSRPVTDALATRGVPF